MATLSSRVLEWAELSSTTGTDNDTALTTPANKATTATEPATAEASGRYVFETAGTSASGAINSAIHYAAMFVSQDAANETYGVRCWGWRKIGTLYVPHLLFKLSLTAGALTGVASQTIDDTWFFPDAITIDDDNTRGTSVEAHVSGTDGTAHVTFDASGFSHIEFEVSCETVAAFVRAFYSAI